MKNFEELYRSVASGINAADNYISEDLEAICDDTMREYAENTLESIHKADESIKTIIEEQKHIPLFLSAMTDIALALGWQRIEFEDSRARESLIRTWAEEFVVNHKNTDWEENDYFNLVDAFAKDKIESYLKDHPRKQYTVKYVLGTEAVHEYNDCIEIGEKWNDSSLCDCGAVSTGTFNTPEELAAYEEGINDANGWLEAEKMMSDEEWEAYLAEYKSDGDDEEDK